MQTQTYVILGIDLKEVGQTQNYMEAKAYVSSHPGATIKTELRNEAKSTLPCLQETTPPPSGDKLVQ